MKNSWYENLFICLSACGRDAELRARCVFTYLSMHEPRSWWEEALRTGTIHRDHALILHKLKIELSKVFHLMKMIDTGLLVAVSFIEDDMPEDAGECFTEALNRYGLHDYIYKAKKVLSERSDLVLLGEMLDDERRLCILERVSSPKENLTDGIAYDNQ